MDGAGARRRTAPENENEYTLGNRYGLQVWGSRVENIDGADPALNPMMTPLADPDLRAGTRLDLLAGIDYRWSMVRLGLEGGAPIAEDLDGPQLETQWMVMGGL